MFFYIKKAGNYLIALLSRFIFVYYLNTWLFIASIMFLAALVISWLVAVFINTKLDLGHIVYRFILVVFSTESVRSSWVTTHNDIWDYIHLVTDCFTAITLTIFLIWLLVSGLRFLVDKVFALFHNWLIVKSESQLPQDRLGREIITTITQLLSTESSLPYTVAIEGKWGGGKTFIMDSVIKELKNSQFRQDTKLVKAEKVSESDPYNGMIPSGEVPGKHKNNMLIVKFNPWSFDKESSIVKAFFIEVGRKYALLRSVTKNLAQSLIEIEPGFLNINLLLSLRQKAITQLKEEFVTLLKKEEKKLVIFIDDIDRLPKENVQDVFQLIAEFDEFRSCHVISFVLAFDRDIIVSHLKDTFQDKDFLEKFIEYSLPIATYQQDLSKMFYDLLDQYVKANNVSDYSKGEFSDAYECLITKPLLYMDEHDLKNLSAFTLFDTPRKIELMMKVLFKGFKEKEDFVNKQEWFFLCAIKVHMPWLYNHMSAHSYLYCSQSLGADDYQLKDHLPVFSSDIAGIFNRLPQGLQNAMKKMFPRIIKLYELYQQTLNGSNNSKPKPEYKHSEDPLSIDNPRNYFTYFPDFKGDAKQKEKKELQDLVENYITNSSKSQKDLRNGKKKFYELSTNGIDAINVLSPVLQRLLLGNNSDANIKDWLLSWTDIPVSQKWTYKEASLIKACIKLLFPRLNSASQSEKMRVTIKKSILDFLVELLKCKTTLSVFVSVLSDIVRSSMPKEAILFHALIKALKVKIKTQHKSLELYVDKLLQSKSMDQLHILFAILVFMNDPADYFIEKKILENRDFQQYQKDISWSYQLPQYKLENLYFRLSLNDNDFKRLSSLEIHAEDDLNVPRAIFAKRLNVGDRVELVDRGKKDSCRFQIKEKVSSNNQWILFRLP